MLMPLPIKVLMAGMPAGVAGTLIITLGRSRAANSRSKADDQTNGLEPVIIVVEKTDDTGMFDPTNPELPDTTGTTTDTDPMGGSTDSTDTTEDPNSATDKKDDGDGGFGDFFAE